MCVQAEATWRYYESTCIFLLYARKHGANAPALLIATGCPHSEAIDALTRGCKVRMQATLHTRVLHAAVCTGLQQPVQGGDVTQLNPKRNARGIKVCRGDMSTAACLYTCTRTGLAIQHVDIDRRGRLLQKQVRPFGSAQAPGVWQLRSTHWC